MTTVNQFAEIIKQAEYANYLALSAAISSAPGDGANVTQKYTSLLERLVTLERHLNNKQFVAG